MKFNLIKRDFIKYLYLREEELYIINKGITIQFVFLT